MVCVGGSVGAQQDCLDVCVCRPCEDSGSLSTQIYMYISPQFQGVRPCFVLLGRKPSPLQSPDGLLSV